MKKVMLVLLMVMVIGCGNLIPRYYWEVSTSVGGPNWTQDNKVCFILSEIHSRFREDAWGTSLLEQYANAYMYEINADGTGISLICTVYVHQNPPTEPISTSSAGEWVVACVGTREIYLLKRDGSDIKVIGRGLHPDFSPDASRIVYEKPDSGIWIMNRDGSNNHCIVPDPDAKYPAWSPDGGRIAFISDSLFICDTSGNLLLTYGVVRVRTSDWGPIDTNAISLSYDTPGSGANIIIVYLSTDKIDTLDIISGNGSYWSPNGTKFIGYDGSWFVINRVGTNKWYLKDKIEGGEQ